MSCIESFIKDEYLLSSEIAALSLSKYEYKLVKLKENIIDYLMKLYADRNYEKFSLILNKIIIHYSSILSHTLIQYIYTLLSSNNVQGEYRIALYKSISKELYQDSDCSAYLKRIIPQSIRDNDSSAVIYILDEFKVFYIILSRLFQYYKLKIICVILIIVNFQLHILIIIIMNQLDQNIMNY